MVGDAMRGVNPDGELRGHHGFFLLTVINRLFSDRGGDPRSRKLVAEAELAELTLAERKGEFRENYVHVREVETTLSEWTQQLTQQLRACPPRCAPGMLDMQARIRAEINRALDKFARHRSDELDRRCPPDNGNGGGNRGGA